MSHGDDKSISWANAQLSSVYLYAYNACVPTYVCVYTVCTYVLHCARSAVCSIVYTHITNDFVPGGSMKI